MSSTRFTISSDFSEAVKNRYVKYFRFDNSSYWRDYYAKKLKNVDVQREKLYADILLRYLGSSARVLDVGCGIGFLSKEISAKGLRVTGIDLFKGMLSAAKQYLKGTDVELVQSDILKYQCKGEADLFDCVAMISVIEHFPEAEVRDDILPKIKSLLKSHGYLFLHFPVKTPYSIFAKYYRKYFEKDLPSWAIDDDGDITHKMWLNYKAYISLVESCGFKIVNYDFNLYRSNLRPKWITSLMRKLQNSLTNNDGRFINSIDNEIHMVKLNKYLKSKLALTSYMLFEKIL